MTIPLTVTCRQMEPSPAFETRIRDPVARFEKCSDHIQRCHIIVESLPGRSESASRFPINRSPFMGLVQPTLHTRTHTSHCATRFGPFEMLLGTEEFLAR